MLAVVDDDPNVLQRKPRDSAFAESQSHALLHRGNELAGNGAADHFIDEFEPLAALERFDAQEHFPELPCAARLFLVAAMSLSLLRDRFPIRNAGRMGVHVHAVALGHSLEQNAHVELAHAVQHSFVQGSVMLDANAGIFGGQLVKGVGESLFVAPAFGLYGDTMHRRGKETERRWY